LTAQEVIVESAVYSVVAHLSLCIIAFLFIVLIIRWFRLPALRPRTEWFLTATIACAVFSAACGPVLPIIARLATARLDLYIFRIDQFLGYREFWMGKLVSENPWSVIVINVAYNLITSVVLGVFAYYMWARSQDETRVYLRTMFLNFLLALPIYLVIPVCGPRYAFSTFPYLPASPVIAHLLSIRAVPNGIPSVHTSTALLVLWFLRRPLWGKIAGSIFVILTIAATTGGGEHYVFDLICALPYTALLIYLGGPSPKTESVLDSADIEKRVFPASQAIAQ
jgi:hypothetical protein